MSENEKNAIIELNLLANTGVYGAEECINQEDKDNIKIILNLIEKQQKEIEEKTTMIFSEVEKNKILEKEIVQLNEDLLDREQTSFDFRYMSIRLQEEKDLLTKMNKKLIDESISKNKVKELKKEKIKILEREKGNQDFIMEDTLISQISVLDELLESE